MKAVLFVHLLYLILNENLTAEGGVKCESKVELRAALLSCPTKDSGCEDDDPLTVAMKAEEAQILHADSKNFESLKEEKERGFPNAIKDCKRKLIITLKVKNTGKIPCDDEYIVIDHVFDPITGGKGRLLSPVVLKLRQEQMVQLYGLQFLKVVNSDPFEEQKETKTACSVDPDSPTCGIAMYDGKPIPFSEGFCCSCDPHVNAKRQLSPVSRGDSFLYRDSKLISQGNDRFIREEKSSSAIFNPELVKLKSGKTSQTPSNRSEELSDDHDEGKEEECCPVKGLSPDKLPNYMLEHDRKIVCDKADFVGELCKLQDEKNKEGAEVYNVPASPVKLQAGKNKLIPNENNAKKNSGVAQVGRQTGGVPGAPVLVSGGLQNALVLKDLAGALREAEDGSSGPGTSSAFDRGKSSRGKRENPQKSSQASKSAKELTLQEKLENFVKSKKLLRNRRKRLLELSHKGLRKAEIRCRDAADCQKVVVVAGVTTPEGDYVQARPPKYFFSHDKFILDSSKASWFPVNSSCKATNCENLGAAISPGTKVNPNQNFLKTYQESPKDEHLGISKETFQKESMPEKEKKDRVSNNARGNNGIDLNREKLKNRVGDFVPDEDSQPRKSDRFKGETEDKEKENEADKEKLESSEENQRSGNEEEMEYEKMQNRDDPKPQKGLFKIKTHGNKSKEERKQSKPKSKNPVNKNRVAVINFKSDMKKNNNKHETKTGSHGPVKGKSQEKKYEELFKQSSKSKEEEQEDKEENLEEERKPSEREENENDVSKQTQNKKKKKNKGESRKGEISDNGMYLENRPRIQQFGKNRAGATSSNQNEMDDERKYYLSSALSADNPKSHFSKKNEEESKSVGFDFEIIKKKIPDVPNFRRYPSKAEQFMQNHIKAPQEHFETKVYNLASELRSKKAGVLKSRPNSYWRAKVPQKYYIVNNERYRNPQDVYLLQEAGYGSFPENRYYYVSMDEKPQHVDQFLRRQQQNHYHHHHHHHNHLHHPETLFYRKRYRGPAFERNVQRIRKNLDLVNRRGSKTKVSQDSQKYKSDSNEIFQNFKTSPGDRIVEDVSDFTSKSTRGKRSAGYPFETAKSFFGSDLKSHGLGDPKNLETPKIFHELENCMPERKIAKSVEDKNHTDKTQFFPSELEDWRVESKLLNLEGEFDYPVITSRKKKEEGVKSDQLEKIASDKERLLQSYANAPDYVLREMEAGMKGKRQTNEENEPDSSRSGHKCGKESGDSTSDTAHCMRFGDLWYSVYLIKQPVVAQIVGIQLFDKHSLCDGTAQWRDLTKGKMVRIGTFLPKAEDDLPSIAMSFIGGKTPKPDHAIDPENFLLMIPSHVSDPSKAGSYPQFEGGPAEYLVVRAKDVSSGGDCDMIGTSFEAFARQPDRCSRPRGSCLKRQPVDLWREDMEARIRGKRGKYFVENFGTVPNSPVKTFTNLTGEYLALEYYGEYTSTIEIEVKADYNAVIRKGSNAQIPSVYIDSSYPKKTRIILSVLNIGLTSANFRPRLGDCPPYLDPAWCPLEGPLVTIPPQQRHDFKLDLSGALPQKNIHVTVQVLNQLNQKVAYRGIIIQKGNRCVCAFHCKCNCIGNLEHGRTCRKLSPKDYRGAGYVGAFPFRGGAATSASESLLSNIHVIFLTASYVLLFLGVAKGILGLFVRRIGVAGTRVIVGPRQLRRYYESELQCCSVLFDECGFPVHPTTFLPVQIVPLWVEVWINFLIFFLYPLRGLWFLILSLPCCKALCADCDGCFRQEDASEFDPNCSHPLLSKHVQPTSVNYNLTTLNARKGKTNEYLPYLPYKGDDDPLEEDDTEFVLQEMKRYRKKVTL